MYHSHVQIYLTGMPADACALLEGIAPLEAVSHSFSRSAQPEPALVSQADLLLCCLPQARPDDLEPLLQAKKPGAALILLTEKQPLGGLSSLLPLLEDVWTLPMGNDELRFRFTRWQQAYKAKLDAWQTSQYLEAAINSVPNLVWYKTKDGVHEKVNDSFCRTVNKTKEQVQGRRHAYIWDVEQDDPACIESEEEVMRHRRTFVSEEQVQTGAGPRLLTTYKSPLYDLDGSVMGTVGVAIDITQERAFEQALITKTRTLETLFTTLDCGVIVHSLDGSQILSINQAALRLLGYPSAEALLADDFRMVAHTVVDGDRERLRQDITALKNEGDSISVEYRVRHEDGEIYHIMGNVKLIKENGQLCYQRFLVDVTRQKRRERQEREEAQRRQNELVQALSTDYNLVCSFDLESGQGGTLRSSGCPYHVLDAIFQEDAPFEQQMERYISTCVYQEDQQAMRTALDRGRLLKELSEKNTFYLNYRTSCANGNILYFQMKVVRAGAWELDRGVVLGLRSVDEETRREMEKTSLLEDALLQAKRANKAKTVFLSNMSHDIRTPMNAIIGFTALALTHIERREQVEEYLKKIMTSGNHLLSLINDVLDMSRIESGKLQLEEKACSLSEILHGLRNIVQADVHAKQLDLSMDTVGITHEDIICDSLRLNQVLLNILGNAIKYTRPGGTVNMCVTEKPNAPEGFASFDFRIQDTGIGMSREFVTHIFEPFEREQNSTTSGIQGTGLGMAITKNIVDMMNGTIEVESEQGVGSSFTVGFTFRLSGQLRKLPSIPQLEGCRALVADDDFNTCDSVSSMLQQIGLRAEWTLSGKEAVLRTRQAFMRGDGFKVYIIDWLLPDMNGLEVARHIRKETGEDAPIIVLTAYDWSDIEEEAREAGITAFCSKPLFISELQDTLSAIVNKGQGPAASPPPQEKVRSGRILLAEDNELNQEIATAILEEAGFTTEVASNGQIAVDMLKNAQPGYYRLVLMDVQMPVMNGYEATKAIRQLDNKELASIPILAMTANAFDEDKQEALRSGMNGHVAKPINISALLDTLDSLLQ